MPDNENAVEVTTDPALSAEPTVADPTIPAAAYSGEDIAKAREQEKNKLYPQMEKMKEELAALKRAEEERLAAEEARKEQRRQRDAEAAAQKKREEEEALELRDLLRKKEEEWQAQFEQVNEELRKRDLIIEREREFQEVQNYRNQRVEQERDNIVPELIDLIAGNNVDEIEQSINVLKEKSARILDSVAQAAQSSRKEMQGASLTGLPASGPLDNDSDPRSFSPDRIAEMTVEEYAKNRSKLLGGASNNRGQGLFG